MNRKGRPRPHVFTAQVHGARFEVDNTPERCVRPEASTCCGDAYYPRWRKGALALVCLWCERDFAEVNRGGVVVLLRVPRFGRPVPAPGASP